MTEQQLSYKQCVIKKTTDVYLFWLGAIGHIIRALFFASILAATVLAMGYLVYITYTRWDLIAAKLPAIPTIPWYVYVIGIIIAAPAVYSAVWCFVKRNDKVVKTE